MLAPPGSAPCVPAASYTGGKFISIFISMNIYFSSVRGVKKREKRDHSASVEVEVGGGGSSEREIVHSGMKNHCVTSGEKYCCCA